LSENISLRQQIYRWLEENILSKPEMDRTERDKLAVSMGRGFGDILAHYEPSPHKRQPSVVEQELTQRMTRTIDLYTDTRKNLLRAAGETDPFDE